MESNEIKQMTLLSGNEAVARGIYEAGVKFASAYPGTPSTEILENVRLYKEVQSQWANNEKVAMESAYGAAVAGQRSVVTMKHVGLNVAMDPFMTSAQGGVNGGLVVVVADDPSMHSSQNEQDTRNLAKFGRVGMFEPADAAEALEYTKLAFELSEKFDLPFLIRLTTRVSHAKSLVKLGERVEIEDKKADLPFTKYVMLPANSRKLRVNLEEKLAKLSAYSEDFNRKTLEYKDKKLGIVTSSVAALYAKEVYPEASFLKIGLSNPLPDKLLKEFASEVEQILVIEELDPYLENHIRTLGIQNVKGKEVIPAIGELNIDILSQKEEKAQVTVPTELPNRPPVLCPGCSHRGSFWALKRAKAIVSGDIGCYTLAALPPLQAMNTCLCMGASIGLANGLYKALPEKDKKRLVAVVGDSTFWHTGLAALVDAVYNDAKYTVVILDNSTTAMTGHQDHPSSGRHLDGSPTEKLDFEAILKAMGIGFVKVVNPLHIKETTDAYKESFEYDGLAVVIAKAPCVVRYREAIKPYFEIDQDKCTACGACLKIGCPAITKNTQTGKSQIDPILCTGCSVCSQVCPPTYSAIAVHK